MVTMAILRRTGKKATQMKRGRATAITRMTGGGLGMEARQPTKIEVRHALHGTTILPDHIVAIQANACRNER
jgi:hypothetical protein